MGLVDSVPFLKELAGYWPWAAARRKPAPQALVRRQAKQQQTVRFDYTNQAGETREREVEPYEIKDGYLWAVDIEKPEHIRRYFVDKLKNVRPGTQEFEPRWEIKVAMEKQANLKDIGRGVKQILSSRATAMRAAEGVAGGAAGAGVGAYASMGEEEVNRREKILGGMAAGATLSLLGSKLLRRGRMNKKFQNLVAGDDELQAVMKQKDDIIRKAEEQMVNKAMRQEKNVASVFDQVKQRLGVQQIDDDIALAIRKGLLGNAKPRGLTPQQDVAWSMAKNFRQSYRMPRNQQLRQAAEMGVLRHQNELAEPHKQQALRYRENLDKKLFGLL